MNYREEPQHTVASNSSYVLRFEDERQLADHLAFLAQESEGFPAIAAVCIEEQPDGQGLVVRLARKPTQTDNEPKARNRQE